MSVPMQNQLESALAGLRAQQEKIREFRAAMVERTTTVTSKNRMISATVGSGGKLVALAFKGNRYRNLPPAELSALVVETVSRAQRTAAKEAMEAAIGLMPNGLGLPAFASGDLDMDKMVDAALEVAAQPIFTDDLAKTIMEKGKNHG